VGPSANGARQLGVVLKVILLLFNPEHPEGFLPRNLKSVKGPGRWEILRRMTPEALHESESQRVSSGKVNGMMFSLK
jgi:hypothetical protein